MRYYYTYIITNKSKTVLYTGVTNNLESRLLKHKENAMLNKTSFAGIYSCYYLLYFESYQNIRDAIAREKEIKGWNRKRKIELIKSINPGVQFLNES